MSRATEFHSIWLFRDLASMRGVGTFGMNGLKWFYTKNMFFALMTQCETNILCQSLLVSSKMSQVNSMAILMFEVNIHPVFFMGFLDFSCHTTRHMCRSWRKKPWQSYPRIHLHLPWWCMEPRTDGVVLTDATRGGWETRNSTCWQEPRQRALVAQVRWLAMIDWFYWFLLHVSFLCGYVVCLFLFHTF